MAFRSFSDELVVDHCEYSTSDNFTTMKGDKRKRKEKHRRQKLQLVDQRNERSSYAPLCLNL